MPSIVASTEQSLSPKVCAHFVEAVQRALSRHADAHEFAVEANGEAQLGEESVEFDGALRASDSDKRALVVKVTHQRDNEAATAQIKKTLFNQQASVGVLLSFATDPSIPPVVHFASSVYTQSFPDSSPSLYTTPPYTITCTAPSPSQDRPDSSSSDSSAPRRLSPSRPAHLVSKGDSAQGDAGLLPNLELPLGPFLNQGAGVRSGDVLLVEGKAMRSIVTNDVYDRVQEAQ